MIICCQSFLPDPRHRGNAPAGGRRLGEEAASDSELMSARWNSLAEHPLPHQGHPLPHQGQTRDPDVRNHPDVGKSGATTVTSEPNTQHSHRPKNKCRDTCSDEDETALHRPTKLTSVTIATDPDNPSAISGFSAATTQTKKINKTAVKLC